MNVEWLCQLDFGEDAAEEREEVAAEAGEERQMNRFTETLNARYVSTHLGRSRSLAPDQLASYAAHYRRVFLPHLPTHREAHVLEVGCGMGHFLHFLKEEGYLNHWGIDIGQEQVELCRQHVTPQVEWVADSRQYLLERSGFYEAIVLIDVLEHTEDDQLFPFLDALHQALTPRGKLLISVPNAACITALVTLYGDMTHRRLFTEGSLTQLLLAAGFDNVRMHPNEKKVIRSFRSRRERWMWQWRERLARWLLSEFHTHLMEGSYPAIQTINLLGVAERP